jgi:hypothetical protein
MVLQDDDAIQIIDGFNWRRSTLSIVDFAGVGQTKWQVLSINIGVYMEKPGFETALQLPSSSKASPPEEVHN